MAYKHEAIRSTAPYKAGQRPGEKKPVSPVLFRLISTSFGVETEEISDDRAGLQGMRVQYGSRN